MRLVHAFPLAVILALATTEAFATEVTVATPVELQYDRVPITFTLTAPGNNDNNSLDVTVEFSTNGAVGPFSAATEAVGAPSEGTIGLGANPLGATHVFVWNSFYDMNIQQVYASKQLVIRITALPSGSNGGTNPFMVDNTVISTVAGVGFSASVGDGGPAVEATFYDIWQLASAPDGSFLVADNQNHRIRKFSVGGTVSTVVGDGFSHNPLPSPAPISAGFAPKGVTVDQAGIVFYASSDAGTVRAVNFTLGNTTVVAGTGILASGPDGVPANQSAINAKAILALPGNVVLIAESVGARIRSFNYTVDSQGIVTPGNITTVCGTGTAGFSGDGGLATAAKINAPMGLALDDQGRIVFVDQVNQVIRRFTIGGTITTIAGTAGTAGFSGDGGPALTATFSNPSYVAVDVTNSIGTVYVTDTGNNRVRRITPAGMIDTVAGNGGLGENGFGGPATAANVTAPFGIAVNPTDGSVIVAENGTARCLRFQPDGNLDAVAGVSASASIGDGGPANQAVLKQTGGLGISYDGTGLYIADSFHFRLRSLDFQTGTIQTVAGNGLLGNAGDGGLAVNASIAVPSMGQQDASGSIYISERNNGHIVRKVDGSGTISSFAGTGTAGFAGDDGPAKLARVNNPASVLASADGSVYFADTANNRIRRIDTAGIISTVVGTGVRPATVEDNTPPLMTPINGPWALAFDHSGTLYYSELTGNRVRKVVSGGNVFTVAGSNQSTPGFNGDNIPATSALLSGASGIALDAQGGLYISDISNRRVRFVDTAGIITTIAGNGEVTGGPDGVPPTMTTLASPGGLAVDSLGNIYVGEQSGQRVRRFRKQPRVLTGPSFENQRRAR